ncbi:MAG: hypothetical protein J7K00_04100 [Candidatus Diapherotrites archaeon]|nr:hypothetical protein [Candidatus Diapherotrites archaeon]
MVKFTAIMERVKSAWVAKNPEALRFISNTLIEEASLHHDKTLAKVSLLCYSLSKIISKIHFKKQKTWGEFNKDITHTLSSAVMALNEGNGDKFTESLHMAELAIHVLDKESGNFATFLMDKARIKQASRLYSLGRSLSDSADLTGAPKDEVMLYIGSTRETPREEKDFRGVNLKQRFSTTKTIFGGEKNA